MAATLTLCASRKMLSSVCLLPIPLTFHCSMLNVFSGMVGVWAGLGGGEGARDCGGVIQTVSDTMFCLTNISTNDIKSDHPSNNHTKILVMEMGIC